jgi:hypothetical protein
MAAEVPVEEVPEVLEYLNAKEELESFFARNPKYVQEERALIDQYNTKLEAAGKVVRDKKVSCGPFKQLTPQIKIHAEKLFNAIGRAEFVKMGGVVGTEATYDMDKKTFEAAVARKAIPEELVPVVKETIVKFNVIPKAVLP